MLLTKGQQSRSTKRFNQNIFFRHKAQSSKKVKTDTSAIGKAKPRNDSGHAIEGLI